MNTLHDVNTVAERWSISPWTVRTYVKQGKLKPVRIGTRVLFEEEELERFLEECRSAGASRDMSAKSHEEADHA